ncbi:MAG: LUD domain-containing protein [Chloroflexota bacterium]
MSTDPFRTQIRAALANSALQAALDANAERRNQGRQQAFASLPDLQERRQRAHAVRSEVIAHLDDYLQEFIERLGENGITVHRASSADEACQITLDIIQGTTCRPLQRPLLVAKSKSMLSEEIQLNQALETAGHRVVETDLGEYIVQLRGERPSHIITPAVHLRRQEVGFTFAENLGIEYTEDVPTLTTIARHTLRQVFLNADVGISGVNFGVAETATLCIVTNEGNGRMVTTLPPVHIALMGIERLVPSMDDLALMLSLLPRYATGQKITVYTNLIHSPRRPDDPDGPDERHLILIDNGRSSARSSPLAEALLCIRCGACLNACPVFREIGGHAYVGRRGKAAPYPGPIGGVISPALLDWAEFSSLAQASSLCGACREACPVDIDLPKLLLRVRSNRRHARPDGLQKPVKSALRLFAWLASNVRRFVLAQRLAIILSRALFPRSEWIPLPKWTGWGMSKDLPRPAVRPFYKKLPESTKTSEASSPSGNPSTGEKAASLRSNHIDPLHQFTNELSALGGTVTSSSQELLGKNILNFLGERGIAEVLSWEEGNLPRGLVGELRGSGIRLVSAPKRDVRVGLTGALAGIAETGTLVIPSAPGQPATASLLPEIHIAILHKEDIYSNLPQVLNLREVREASVVTLISGPSRTADIEMTLTIGVHGPAEVHVFCT